MKTIFRFMRFQSYNLQPFDHIIICYLNELLFLDILCHLIFELLDFDNYFAEQDIYFIHTYFLTISIRIQFFLITSYILRLSY